MKALSIVFLMTFASIAQAAQDTRCECTDYWSGGYTFWCEGKTIQFIPDKQAGSHAAAKAACEKAQSDFLKMETRISCKDPKGSLIKADLTFNNQNGSLAVTFADGNLRSFTIDRVDVTNTGSFYNNLYTFRFAAYSGQLGLILDVIPHFWTDDMSNTDHFDGYFAQIGLGIDRNLICDLHDLL